MRTKLKIILFALPLVAVLAPAAWYFRAHPAQVLAPAGQVGRKERNLMWFSLLLSALVVLPVFTITIAFALKSRESNHRPGGKKVRYQPEWDGSRLYESIWWGIPGAIILILSIVTWQSSHMMDPYRALVSSKKPLTVQVVAMDWKWLFIYPEQHMASVNMVEFPKGTPVDFQITSDSVMNSFWIPRLGGQIYAMPGMATQLHLVADRTGSFFGSPANIAGKGFAHMDFTAKSVSDSDFQAWIAQAQHSSQALTTAAYNKLALPSQSNPVAYYSQPASNLYNDIIMKYMMPGMSGLIQ